MTLGWEIIQEQIPADVEECPIPEHPPPHLFLKKFKFENHDLQMMDRPYLCLQNLTASDYRQRPNCTFL